MIKTGCFDGRNRRTEKSASFALDAIESIPKAGENKSRLIAGVITAGKN